VIPGFGGQEGWQEETPVQRQLHEEVVTGIESNKDLKKSRGPWIEA